VESENGRLGVVVRIIVCPPTTQISSSSKLFPDIFSQHVDSSEMGACTGSNLPEFLKLSGAKGSLLNHSERRVSNKEIELTLLRMNKLSLETIVCAATPFDCSKIAKFKPPYLAVEPPELIGSGVSVSNAKPEVVTKSLNLVKEVSPKTTFLCGAGVSNKEDIVNALKLGTEGVLLASAFVKAKDPKEFLRNLCSAF
jgi:triosephosphate isomerase